MHCVDLGESFPTNICLQNLASIQPRTRFVKFAPLSAYRSLRYVELIGPPNVARAFAQAGKLNNKPYFRSPEGDVLFYYPDEDYWVVSAKLGGKSAKAYAMADEGENPIDATEWYIHTPDGFTKDAMVRWAANKRFNLF